MRGSRSHTCTFLLPFKSKFPIVCESLFSLNVINMICVVSSFIFTNCCNLRFYNFVMCCYIQSLF